MKKIFLSLVALLTLTSANAQLIEIIDNGEVIARYENLGKHNYEVKLSQMDNTGMIDTKAVDDTGEQLSVGWVQLWENGPRYANQNLGANSMYEDGLRYNYTEAQTAIEELWGDEWTLPTDNEWSQLCEAFHAGKISMKLITVNDKYYLKFTGMNSFANNFMILPLCGIYKTKTGGSAISDNGYSVNSTMYWATYTSETAKKTGYGVGMLAEKELRTNPYPTTTYIESNWLELETLYCQIRPVLKVNK